MTLVCKIHDRISGFMRSRRGIEKELQKIKGQIQSLSSNNANVKELADSKAKTEETGSNLLALVRYMMDENRKTTMVLKNISDSLAKIDYDLNANYSEETNPVQEAAKELPISELDKTILQHIQIAGMACADDIKKNMNYKGRNAASARLNRLHKQGLLERYQLGHKVYYKYDAGKAAKTLIVSPPQ